MFTKYLDYLHYWIYNRDISKFQFNETIALGSTSSGITICILYLTTLYVLNLRKAPLNIPTWIPALHNLLLTALSAVLFLWMSENAAYFLFKKGLLFSVCAEESYSPRVEFIMYLNYLTKYYELVDTLFLVLKKKKLEFLHVYHHSRKF
eukprot:NODE_157_length_15108_cov_0.423079.p9 type:complete len:149 gc:universal NODE_157_length_15108_cov_0.423079:4999-5445(+)